MSCHQLFHVPRTSRSCISSVRYRMQLSYMSNIYEMSRTIWCHQLVHVPRPFKSYLSSARYRMKLSFVRFRYKCHGPHDVTNSFMYREPLDRAFRACGTAHNCRMHMSCIYEMSQTIWCHQLFHILRPLTSWISSAQYRMPASYKSDICEMSRTIWCHQLIHVPRPLRSWISSARYRMPVSCVSLESWISWQYFSKVSSLVVLCREYSGERSVENFELRTTKLTHTFCTVNLVESGLLRKLCPSIKLSSI